MDKIQDKIDNIYDSQYSGVNVDNDILKGYGLTGGTQIVQIQWTYFQSL